MGLRAGTLARLTTRKCTGKKRKVREIMIDDLYGLTSGNQPTRRKIIVPLGLFFLLVLFIWFIYPGGYSGYNAGYNAGFEQGQQDGLNDTITRIDVMNMTLIVIGNTTSLANATEDQVWKFNVTFESNCELKSGIFSGGEQVIYRHCWNTQKIVPTVLVDCPVTETYRGINVRPAFLSINQTKEMEI